MTEASAEEEFHFPSARTSPFEAPSAYGRAREQGLVEATMYNGCPTWLATPSVGDPVRQLLLRREHSEQEHHVVEW
jgi:hypothetical protein